MKGHPIKEEHLARDGRSTICWKKILLTGLAIKCRMGRMNRWLSTRLDSQTPEHRLPDMYRSLRM